MVKKRLSSYFPGSIEKAATILANNGIIIYPTDTLYGFGCDATNEKAIIKLNKLKNRTLPMSVLAHDKDTASGWMDIPENEKGSLKNNNVWYHEIEIKSLKNNISIEDQLFEDALFLL